MIKRLARRVWKPSLAIAVAALAVTSVALAASYTVIFGTSGADNVDKSSASGNFHIYTFQGSDTIKGGKGNITKGILGIPQINGFDELYGDGRCSQTPPGDDSYCDHPSPWLPQDWTDSSGSTDTITGGNGPETVVGGGGNNVLTGSQTYDVISGGPHHNTITGSGLGSSIFANQSGEVSKITLKATTGKVGYQGLIGFPNYVDVYNGGAKDTVICASRLNGDTVYADRGDTITNCAFVFYSKPIYLSTASASSSGSWTAPAWMSKSSDRAASHKHKRHAAKKSHKKHKRH
jgi:Ca2+-binding RTX toxin-like protein